MEYAFKKQKQLKFRKYTPRFVYAGIAHGIVMKTMRMPPRCPRGDIGSLI